MKIIENNINMSQVLHGIKITKVKHFIKNN